MSFFDKIEQFFESDFKKSPIRQFAATDKDLEALGADFLLEKTRVYRQKAADRGPWGLTFGGPGAVLTFASVCANRIDALIPSMVLLGTGVVGGIVAEFRSQMADRYEKVARTLQTQTTIQ